MKFLLAAMLLLSSSLSLASGKLSLKQTRVKGEDVAKYALGLSVYQKPASFPVAFVGWAGGGVNEHNEEPWVKTESGLEGYVGPMAVYGGVTWEQELDSKEITREANLKVSLTLW